MGRIRVAQSWSMGQHQPFSYLLKPEIALFNRIRQRFSSFLRKIAPDHIHSSKQAHHELITLPKFDFILPSLAGNVALTFQKSHP